MENQNKIEYTYFWYHHGLKYNSPVYDEIERALSCRNWQMFEDAKKSLQKIVNRWNIRAKRKWHITDFLPDNISRFDNTKPYDSDEWYSIVDLNEENFAKITRFESENG